MASRVTEKQSKRTSPYTISRRKRSLKGTRVAYQDGTKRSAPQRVTPNSAETNGSRVLTPREQVLEAYANVYVPTTDHIQAPVLKKLFEYKSILSLSSQLVTVTARLIQTQWESSEQPTENVSEQGQSGRAKHLTGYISAILARSSMLRSNTVATHLPSFSTIALIFALVYVERLKRLHPNARGEAGCGHRLFLVSYMVASKYLQGHLLARSNRIPQNHPNSQVPDTRGPVSEEPLPLESSSSSSVLPSIILPNEQWARLSGVFSTPELTRMELELLAFLQFDLYVSYEDFLYHWTKYMDINQLVPNQHLAGVSVGEESDDEGVVPEF
ncbi:hypothetical protein K493DRAFT_315526 [Basidiobolus meristosporus CBS 931.73]|uniref:Cyclin N-terminal domain-containing protein n=1 Tax=Basidiobolus meristosporus CBS 931.73 TaxID=1314790 RepID=A0A1Y1Y9B8_9FUNG|nr:hypothetical protein K493DRAFT_315526 [Basidiobolus meristosporus CBS 931.73]|eukprot:ORX94336.1 hypothetical protein K493DRAFT_315526 [Basidiobolus meristosporus CBS 931.73]